MPTTSALLDHAERLREQHEARVPVDERKRRGQVFTPPAVSRFMAGLLEIPGGRFRLLDPGAGVGSLTAAVCERLLRLRQPRAVEIHAFETDSDLAALLEEVLKECASAMEEAGHQAAIHVHRGDFILGADAARDQGDLFAGPYRLGEFDAAIMNPPYFKIAGDSEYARALGDVVHGQPNIYALFMAQAARMLRRRGQLVAITPRSFCNGLYFREFRRWYFSKMSLRHVHLFESRRATFEGVLQESVVTVARLDGGKAGPVAVSHSPTGRDLESVEALRLPARDVLDDSAGEMVVRIPAGAADVAIIEAADRWPRFEELGLRVSTGPVVDFRATRYLVREPRARGTVPLIAIHNVRPFQTVWPLEKNGRPQAFRVAPGSMPLLLPVRNYVLLRRFSAKEESRRLTASPLLATELRGDWRALENHLNYVYHAERELSVAEVFGLTALFNSKLFDRYFRTFSGNTQVNATEVRTMRVPPLDTVSRIGTRVRRLRLPTPRAETVVLEELGLNGTLRAELGLS